MKAKCAYCNKEFDGFGELVEHRRTSCPTSTYRRGL